MCVIQFLLDSIRFNVIFVYRRWKYDITQMNVYNLVAESANMESKSYLV